LLQIYDVLCGGRIYNHHVDAVFVRERRDQMLCECNFSSWRWAC